MHVRNPLELGLVLRNRRRQLRLTQADLADKIGVGRQWLVAVEKGKHGAELGLVLRAMAELGLSVSIEADVHVTPTAEQSNPSEIDAVLAAAHSARP
ncbi:MAG: helix-turn-helix domain-containing protein [Gammaproteobacteria bacterium]|nr:helix-turn-helix domain-containing protein [Gammaproteobacteria bacterium]